MKNSEIRELRDEELQNRLGDLQRHLFDLHSQAVTEKLENTKAIPNVKRDIARVKTIIKERELKDR